MNSKDKKMLVFGIYLILILCMFCFHENWRDEVQAYLLCRDMNFIELLKNVHYEGHPFFYYLILYPLVKLGFSMKIVNILSLIFMSLSAYLVLYKSKLRDINKFSIVFSFLFLYEYSIIGRSYSLVTLLIILIALLWDNKKKNAIVLSILIGLLLNSHVFLGGFCFLLFISFYVYQLLFNREKNSKKENTNILIGLLIISFFGIILILQFFSIILHGVSMSINNNFSAMKVLQNMFIVFASFRISRYFVFILVMLICMLLFLFLLYKENKNLFVLLVLNMVLFSCISTYVFGSLTSHNALIPILFIYFVCLINHNLKSNYILFILFLFFIPNVIISCLYDINYLYSSAELAYEYIDKNISKDSVIITMYDAHASTIMGYSKDYKIYDLKSNRFYTYVVWDEKRENHTINFEYIDRELEYKSIYYISIKDDIYDYDRMIKEHYILKKIYESKEDTVLDENYVIYKVKSIKGD